MDDWRKLEADRRRVDKVIELAAIWGVTLAVILAMAIPLLCLTGCCWGESAVWEGMRLDDRMWAIP